MAGIPEATQTTSSLYYQKKVRNIDYVIGRNLLFIREFYKVRRKDISPGNVTLKDPGPRPRGVRSDYLCM